MLSLDFSVFPVIETDRLLLRCLVPGDAEQLFFFRTDENVMRYLDREVHKTVEETSAYIEMLLDSQHKNESVLWVIELKEKPGDIAGTIGYWRIAKENYRAETGYTLHPAHWRKGITKEALKAVIRYAFTKTELHSIEANINPGNIASAALLKSSGFIQEAYFKENFFFNGVFIDTIIYSLVKTPAWLEANGLHDR